MRTDLLQTFHGILWQDILFFIARRGSHGTFGSYIPNIIKSPISFEDRYQQDQKFHDKVDVALKYLLKEQAKKDSKDLLHKKSQSPTVQ